MIQLFQSKVFIKIWEIEEAVLESSVKNAFAGAIANLNVIWIINELTMLIIKVEIFEGKDTAGGTYLGGEDFDIIEWWTIW